MGVKECIFDQGGYFIIGGGEKVIVAKEKMATNFVYVFNKKEQSYGSKRIPYFIFRLFI